MNCREEGVAGNQCRGRGWPEAAALQTHTGDAPPIAPSSFIAMPLSQLLVRPLTSHDRSESGTVGTATALLPLATSTTLLISIKGRVRPIRVAPFDTTAQQHVIHVSSTLSTESNPSPSFYFLFFFFCLLFHLFYQLARLTSFVSICILIDVSNDSVFFFFVFLLSSC